MINLLAIMIFSTVVAVAVGVWGSTHKTGTYYKSWPAWAAIVTFLFGFAAVACLVIAIAVPATHSYARTVCSEYAAASERQTRFERYSFWEWECLVRTDEGWVAREQIVKVDD